MDTAKSIAFLCHPYHRGGVTRWMADAAIAWSLQGHEVYFITLEPSREFHSGKGRETMLQLLSKKEHRIKVFAAKVAWEFEFGLPAYNASVYEQLLVRHIPPGTPIILSDDAFVWQGATQLHAMFPVVGVLHADEAHYYNLAKKYHNEVAIFINVSSRVHKIVSAQVPAITASRLFTIPCGIDLPKVRGGGAVAHNELRLVYVGRISQYQKRTGDLAKIAEALMRQKIPFHLTIIGDGLEDKKALQQQVKEAGLEAMVTFKGWLTQAKVYDFLLSSDVLLLTSDFEGMPISMMEALAAGCGFAGTRVSGIEDFEFHPLARDCFKVFNIGDIDDAVAKIRQLAQVPSQVRRSAARQLAESQFSMRICLDRYESALHTIPPKKYERVNVSISRLTRLKSAAVAMIRHAKMRMKKN